MFLLFLHICHPSLILRSVQLMKGLCDQSLPQMGSLSSKWGRRIAQPVWKGEGRNWGKVGDLSREFQSCFNVAIAIFSVGVTNFIFSLFQECSTIRQAVSVHVKERYYFPMLVISSVLSDYQPGSCLSKPSIFAHISQQFSYKVTVFQAIPDQRNSLRSDFARRMNGRRRKFVCTLAS